jgi:hypothetical protein
VPHTLIERSPLASRRGRGVRRACSGVMPRFEQCFVRRERGRVSGGVRDELQLQRISDGLRDVVLNSKDVCQLPVASFRPEMIPVPALMS